MYSLSMSRESCFFHTATPEVGKQWNRQQEDPRWKKARAEVLSEQEQKTPLDRHVYDLRHTGLTTWNNGAAKVQPSPTPWAQRLECPRPVTEATTYDDAVPALDRYAAFANTPRAPVA
ncbi:hypothetical protein NGB36_19795 [Streptomyces sp. RB6PN25]|uniref:Integrase n=1 Tax=Streptomyces humicola TaxID=2953240 RepID=A0ABT1PYP4_9ACTN|nr:hypothetical protein [Streptomyces humicola]MCQ4082786.1 hypothetical protein [Streptomyces humicola]